MTEVEARMTTLHLVCAATDHPLQSVHRQYKFNVGGHDGSRGRFR